MKKADMLMDGSDPRMIGGVHLWLDAVIPKLPKMSGVEYHTALGVALGARLRLLLQLRDTAPSAPAQLRGSG